MESPNGNRKILVIGAALAVVFAVALGLVFAGGRDKSPEPPPASKGGLTVDLADAPSLEPTRELRCFVNGQFVGMATLAVCAQRNGLATDALDVGIDETGNLAAAPTAAFAPPPVAPPAELTVAETPAATPAPAQPSQPSPLPAPTQASGTPCLRHIGSEWRTISTGGSQAACVQALFSGTCVSPGQAVYGRYGEVTLRLVPRRVEQSNDNRRFRTLVEQDRTCQFPGLR